MAPPTTSHWQRSIAKELDAPLTVATAAALLSRSSSEPEVSSGMMAVVLDNTSNQRVDAIAGRLLTAFSPLRKPPDQASSTGQSR